jgi:hypothetical protein
MKTFIETKGLVMMFWHEIKIVFRKLKIELKCLNLNNKLLNLNIFLIKHLIKVN